MVFDTLQYYTTTKYVDTLIQKYGYATNAHLNDTLRHYTTSNKVDTLIKKYGYLTSDSALIVMMRDSIQKVNAHVTADSAILAQRIFRDSTNLSARMDTLLSHVCDSVKSCVTDWISDSTRMVFDTLHKYYATKDTLRNFVNSADLGRANLVIKVNGSPIANFNADQKGNDVEVELSSAANVKPDWNATVGADAEILNKPNIRDSVNTVVLAALASANSEMNNAVDTIAANVIRDTLKAYYDTTNVQRVIADSLKALRDSLQKTADNTILPKECSMKFVMMQDQVGDDTTFTLKSEPHSSYLVKIYINGVLVGDDDSSSDMTPVLRLNPSNKKEVTYRSANNEGYKLEKGDKVIIYWFTAASASE